MVKTIQFNCKYQEDIFKRIPIRIKNFIFAYTETENTAFLNILLEKYQTLAEK